MTELWFWSKASYLSVDFRPKDRHSGQDVHDTKRRMGVVASAKELSPACHMQVLWAKKTSPSQPRSMGITSMMSVCARPCLSSRRKICTMLEGLFEPFRLVSCHRQRADMLRR